MPFGFLADSKVDVGIPGRRDDQKGTRQIARSVCSLHDGNGSGGCP